MVLGAKMAGQQGVAVRRVEDDATEGCGLVGAENCASAGLPIASD